MPTISRFYGIVLFMNYNDPPQKVNEETNTIEWPNGADFAPEFLHEIGKEVRQAV